jgi:diguanylate cyclase (GGDEF)-like protein
MRRPSAPSSLASTAALRHRLSSLERENAGLRAEVERLTRYRDLAYRDDLTDTFNRRYLEARACDALAPSFRGFGCGLVLIDVDRFKSINDRLGHVAGDGVLRSVARTLERRARRNDAVGRWGGDEFYVLLPQTHAAGVRAFVERLTVDLSEIVVIPTREEAERVSCSVGLAHAPEDGSTLEELFAAADRRMYAAKTRTRGLDRPPASSAA